MNLEDVNKLPAPGSLLEGFRQFVSVTLNMTVAELMQRPDMFIPIRNAFYGGALVSHNLTLVDRARVDAELQRFYALCKREAEEVMRSIPTDGKVN